MTRQILKLRELGLQDYQPVWQAMARFTDQRSVDTPDELWLLQHRPVFTQGQAGKEEHLLAPGDIPVVQVDRGGQVTYHGPGQLVAYPLLDIDRRNLGVRDLVCQLEGMIIDLLADYGLKGERKTGAPGVYVAGAKVAALGLRVRQGRTFHGLALNVDMDLEPYSRINPCGYAGQPVVDLARLGVKDLDAVQQDLLVRFAERFGYTVMPDTALPEGIKRPQAD